MAFYHSTNPLTVVYHSNPKCTEGNNIEKRYYKTGKGNKKRLCKRCKNLESKR